MPKPDNRYQVLAREAAARIDGDRALADQLSLLPDEAPGGELVADRAGKRGPGRAMNQMREWLASRGYRLPEDVLAEMAGLASREDALTTAMTQAERVLAWAQSGAVVAKGAPSGPTLRVRLDTLMQLYTIMLRSADALMPYGAPKVTPDQAGAVQVNQIIVQGASAGAAMAQGARDVTPSPAGRTRRIAPPPLPTEIEQKQGLGEAPAEGSDG
jgi:hypothetical protein